MSGPYGPPPPGAPQGPQQPAPGGYGPPPGQGGWAQPPQPSAPRAPMDLSKILPLSVAALGLLNFIWGFLPAAPAGPNDSIALFSTGYSFIPAFLLIAGLLSLGPWEPKGTNYSFPVAILSSVMLILAVILIINIDSAKIGVILLLVFAILQALAAIGAWLYHSGIMKQSAGSSAGFLAPSAPAYPPAPQYGPQGGYGPGAPGAGQGGPGGYPPAPGFGGQPGGAPQGGPSFPPPPGAPGQGGAPGAPAAGGPSSAPDSGSFAAQGGYPPKAPVAPTDGPGGPGGSEGGPDSGPDTGGHPDVTQQVRF